jgi:type IV secretory pathway VirB3-like protein
MQDGFQDPIYKGGTSPPTFLGVPLVPMVIAGTIFGQIALLAFLAVGLPGIAFVLVLASAAFGKARRISKFDDQRILQMMLLIRMRGKQRGIKKILGAVSFAPGAKRLK